MTIINFNNKLSDIQPLTGLRFLAAFLVLITHSLARLMSIPNTIPTWLKPFSHVSAEGMTLFFVLSGFVIHYNYANSIQVNKIAGIYRFFVARFARLWPLYIFCFSLSLLIIAIRYQTLAHQYTTALPYFVILLQSWFYFHIENKELLFQFGTMPSITWSISTEWFFYCCYPIICLFLLKNQKRFTVFLLILFYCLFVISFIFILSIYQTKINSFAISIFGPLADINQNFNDSFFRWFIYYSPYTRISEFLLGCLVAEIYNQTVAVLPSQKEQWFGLLSAGFAIISIIILHYFMINIPTWDKFNLFANLQQCFGFAPSFAILIYCCSRYRNSITRILSHPLFVLGGETSYSIYLLHQIVIGAVVNATNHFIGFSIFKLLIILFCVFGLSIITYRFIEVPARNVIRKWFLLPSQDTVSVRL